MDLKALIRDVPNFPKEGILFRDMTPLLSNPLALQKVADEFGKKFDLTQVDVFAGVESRGFILASFLAAKFAKGFLPIRKAGKLPPPVVSQSYKLEYGEATLELNPGKGRLIVIDDVLATGGTLQAAISVAREAGYTVQDVGVLIDLTFLNQMKFNQASIKSLIQY